MQSTKKKIIMLAILDLLVFGLSYYLFMNIKSINKDVSARIAGIELEAKKYEQLQSIKNILSSTKNEREQLSGFFIKPDALVDFIETVESLGKMASIKLQIESVGIDASKNKGASSTEPFRFSVKTDGSWSDNLYFLSMLESMPYKISINNADMAVSSEGQTIAKDKTPFLANWTGNFGFNVLKLKDAGKSNTD